MLYGALRGPVTLASGLITAAPDTLLTSVRLSFAPHTEQWLQTRQPLKAWAEGVSTRGQHEPGPRPTGALLLVRPHASDNTVARGQSLTHTLSSQGLAVQWLDIPVSADLTASRLEEIIKVDRPALPHISSVIVFDVDAERNHGLLMSACREAGAAGLYSFKASTGMFRKAFGPDEAPRWIDPHVESSYEQMLAERGWNFLSEDKSEPRFAFDLVETGPWERARAVRVTNERDEQSNSASSPLGYCIARMTDEEVDVVATTLTPAQRHVLLSGGTDDPSAAQNSRASHEELAKPERTAATGAPADQERRAGVADEGVYVCALGGLPLFVSDDALMPLDGSADSAWPGFRRAVHSDHVILREETGPLRRMEVLCARSGGHLGHLFDDGPAPSGHRFCINRSALSFIPRGKPLPRRSRPVRRPSVDLDGLGALWDALRDIRLEEASFGGGCFWHVRDDFLAVPGVYDATCGYCGRIEAVRVTFDPVVVPYTSLVEHFFDMHDPTTGDRQGNDWGPQYQAAIFTHDESQKLAAEEAVRRAGQQLAVLRPDGKPRDASEAKVYGTAVTARTDATAVGSSPFAESHTADGNGVVAAGNVLEGDCKAFEKRAARTWWEGTEIRTLVVCTPRENFVADDSEAAQSVRP